MICSPSTPRKRCAISTASSLPLTMYRLMASGAEILRPGRGAASLPALVWAVFFCDALPPMNANRASLVILSLIEPALAAPPETLQSLAEKVLDALAAQVVCENVQVVAKLVFDMEIKD
jgi:hypothetical protein